MKSWTVGILVLVIVVAAVALFAGRTGFRLAEPTPGAPANPSNPPVTSAPDRTAQWKASAHSRITPSEPPLGTRDTCVKCHTGPGFAKQTTKASEVTAAPIGCNDCHDFAGTKERKLRIAGTATLPNKKALAAGTAATCIACHNSRRDTSDPATLKGGSAPHSSPQADLLMGTNAYEYPGTRYTNSVHVAIADSCVACHMAPAAGDPTDAGGHSFRMKTKGGVENVNACRPCHPDVKGFDRTAYGDYDGNGKTEGIQTEVHRLLTKVETAITKLANATKVVDEHGKIGFQDAAGKAVTVADPKVLQAAYNWLFVEADKSLGVHNPSYTVQLLQSTYKAVTGQDVPGAAIR